MTVVSRSLFVWLPLEFSIPSAEGSFGIEGEINENIIDKFSVAINFGSQAEL